MRRPPRVLLRRWLDVAIPLVVGWFLLAVAFDAHQHDERGWLHTLAAVLAIGQAVALGWRRSRPGLVMVIAVAGGLGSQLITPEGLFPAAGLFAVWSLTVAYPPKVSVPAMGALIGIVAVSFGSFVDEDVHFAMGVVVVVWALAEAVRNHRAAVGQEARRAVSEERARIARELHDVLAHSVSVIVVQAAAGDDVFDARPDQAREALRAIETAGREALGELRLLLAAVRPDSPAPTDSAPTRGGAPAALPAGLTNTVPIDALTTGDISTEALTTDDISTGAVPTGVLGGVGKDGGPVVGPRRDSPLGLAAERTRPSPGLDRLDEVTGPLRAAGLEIVVRREGAVRPVPPGVDLSAYRIVQEALTNTLRHARATRAVVELRYGHDQLDVEVRDDGRGAAVDGRAGGGLGLVGMRERVAMLGGRLETGPAPGGGYRVHARLPLAPTRRVEPKP